MARIITISREFGSGGRELGKRLSDILNYDYYDKEIIPEIAKKHQLDEEYVEKTLDNQIWKTIPLTYGRTLSVSYYINPVQTNLLVEEREILEKIAKSDRNCIIVGRNADVLLKDYNPFKIFVCADMDSKINRCLKRQNETEVKTIKAIENEIKSIDKARSKSREMFSDNKWGDKKDYNLIVNTTGWDLKELSVSLANVINTWFESKNVD